MKIVVFGLTISSSWGNGHATLWRGLCRALAPPRPPRRLLRARRALLRRRPRPPELPGGELVLYGDWDEVAPRAERAAAPTPTSRWSPPTARTGSTATRARARRAARAARVLRSRHAGDAVAARARGESLDLYRPARPARFRPRAELHRRRGARRLRDASSARAGSRRSTATSTRRCTGRSRRASDFAADLSYLGTYAADRQAALEALFIEPARRRPERRFLIGGAQYPHDFPWTRQHLLRAAPAAGRAPGLLLVLAALTLNVTRQAMAEMGWCPSGRLFEAAACGAADPDRCVGGPRRVLRARPRDPGRARRPTTRSPRSISAIASCARSPRPARERDAGRAHLGPPRRRARGGCSSAARVPCRPREP